MSLGLKFTGLLVAGLLFLQVALQADSTQTTHHPQKAKKQEPLPPLPSGTQGPVPQIPLDAMPAVAPEVSYQDGMLTIVAPNSTLGDILRGVRKHTAAEIDVPANANERVATRLGPAPAREVLAELLNGSHFNYILLGSPENANKLVRVLLVAKTGPDTPDAPAQAANNAASAAATEAAEADTAEETVEDTTDQNAAAAAAAETDQTTPSNPDQPAVKTPQQMLQEMQQRQLRMQQQQSGQNPVYPPPGGVPPQPQPPEQNQ